uniref:Uncharacterized protein n=1 Tax=Grammatophora oceanica TaxID=210454 RepID=A0A7S1UX47_9STRA|mmetsp:Transcript_24551/g.36032  ORF Transcript_24551/g.36032 Transcript_24551/m.36032 type:complete len:115 (+) Transcript_24551:476-820(+)
MNAVSHLAFRVDRVDIHLRNDKGILRERSMVGAAVKDKETTRIRVHGSSPSSSSSSSRRCSSQNWRAVKCSWILPQIHPRCVVIAQLVPCNPTCVSMLRARAWLYGKDRPLLLA